MMAFVILSISAFASLATGIVMSRAASGARDYYLFKRRVEAADTAYRCAIIFLALGALYALFAYPWH